VNNLQELKDEFLKTNKIKYLDYYGNIHDEPIKSKNTFKPQGILTVYHPGLKEEVL
jgi:hypothetical protein